MNRCRICLSTDPEKDVYEEQTNKKMGNKSFADIILFCLDIQVNDTNISTKICSKCYKKTVSFNKFKTLALKNDAFLRSQSINIKNEMVLKNENMIKTENMSISDDDSDKNNLEIKNEERSQDFESDDELLSVIKNIKYELVQEDTKENEPVKKKRGKPKKTEKVKNVTNEEKRVCDECGLVFRNLKQHMRRHLPISKRIRFPCNLCDKTFASAGSRQKHIKRKHLGIKKLCAK